jgi:hypothetical protein
MLDALIFVPLAQAHQVFMSRRFVNDLCAAEQEEDFAKYWSGLAIAREVLWEACRANKLIITFTSPMDGTRGYVPHEDVDDVLLLFDCSDALYNGHRLTNVMLCGMPRRASFEHNEDYTYVRRLNRDYFFGKCQAKVIELLHKAYNDGRPQCVGKRLLVEAGADSHNISDVFKSQPYWRELIEMPSRGYYRLSIGAHDGVI